MKILLAAGAAISGLAAVGVAAWDRFPNCGNPTHLKMVEIGLSGSPIMASAFASFTSYEKARQEIQRRAWVKQIDDQWASAKAEFESRLEPLLAECKKRFGEAYEAERVRTRNEYERLGAACFNPFFAIGSTHTERVRATNVAPSLSPYSQPFTFGARRVVAPTPPPGAIGGVQDYVEFVRDRLAPQMDERKRLQDKFEAQKRQATNVPDMEITRLHPDWREGLQKASYQFDRITTSARDVLVGSVICKADVWAKIDPWGSGYGAVSYAIERTDEGGHRVTVLGAQ